MRRLYVTAAVCWVLTCANGGVLMGADEGAEVSADWRFVGEVVEQHLAKCHLLVVSSAHHTGFLSNTLRQLQGRAVTATVVLVGRADTPVSKDGRVGEDILKGRMGVWGEARYGCRALLVLLPPYNHTHVLGYLEKAGLWAWPETRVVVVSGVLQGKVQQGVSQGEEMPQVVSQNVSQDGKVMSSLQGGSEAPRGVSLRGKPQGEKMSQGEKVMGSKEWKKVFLSQAKAVLLHNSFRNTVHALYLSLHTPASHIPTPFHTRLRTSRRYDSGQWGENIGVGLGVEVYRRCLYCHGGQPRVAPLRYSAPHYTRDSLPTQSQLAHYFSYEEKDWQGHQFDIVAVRHFPYSEYIRHIEQPGTTVSLSDSLDTRLLNTMAALLNFTYQVREPWDGQFGVPAGGGNWTGIVGTLQYQTADFSLLLAPTPDRFSVVQYSVIFASESFVIVSLKAQPLPQYLSIIRPFEALTWYCVALSVVVYGVVTWALRQVWVKGTGEGANDITVALLFTLRIMAEDPPPSTPRYFFDRMSMGWWLVVCLIVTSAYRSSLMSHLTVPKTPPPVNSFEDLLEADGWRWARRPSFGSSFIFFNTSTDPVVNKVFMNIEHHEDMDVLVQRALKGRYGLVLNRYVIASVIAARYSNALGYTPLHTSTTIYPIYAGVSWGFRWGAPFRAAIGKILRSALEAGLVDQWMTEVIQDNAKRVRAERGKQDSQDYKGIENMQSEKGQVVLSLYHLEGAFLLMFLGQGAAGVLWLAEKVLHPCLSKL